MAASGFRATWSIFNVLENTNKLQICELNLFLCVFSSVFFNTTHH